MGSLVALFLIYDIANLQIVDNKFIPAAMVAESLGSLILTFLYLTQTEEKTKISNDPAISTLIIAATYTAAIFMSAPPSLGGVTTLNPALGLCIPLVNLFD